MNQIIYSKFFFSAHNYNLNKIPEYVKQETTAYLTNLLAKKLHSLHPQSKENLYRLQTALKRSSEILT